MQRFFRKLILLTLPAVFLCFLSTNSPAQAPQLQRILLLGDFLPAGNAEPFIKNMGFDYLFDGIRPVLDLADAVILNLETPLSGQGTAVAGKKYTFRTSPSASGAMGREKVLAVSLANNHIMDFGATALKDTMSHLTEAGIGHAGAGMNLNEAMQPARISLPGGQAFLFAFSNTLPKSFWAKKNRPGTLYGSKKSVSRATSSAPDHSPVIASFHWGAELMIKPKEYQENLARLAVDSGADIVMGHHPHTPQPIEIYRGVPILYSLGNFSFGSYSRNSRVGLMALAFLGRGGRCERLEIYPILVDNYEVNFQPRMITGLEGQQVFDPLVKNISSDQAKVSWDGTKGIIIPNSRSQ